MIVGILVVRIRLPEAGSLKDKRHTVKSLVHRTTSRFGAAAAEIDEQDTWQRARLAFACVSGTEFQARRVLNSIENDISRHPAAEVINSQRRFVGLDEE